MSLDHMKRLALIYLLCIVTAAAATYVDKNPKGTAVIRFIRNLGVSLIIVGITATAMTAIDLMLGKFD